jgi:branched-chain amino acid transport system permease protein
MSLPSGVFQETYGQDLGIVRTKTQWGLLILLLIFLFTIPLYSNDHILTMITIIGITIISVHGLNILTGYCGQISLGHTGFMAVGGYTSAVLCAHLGWSYWLALPAAGLMAGLVGILFGLPSLKVKGFYLIMATVAAYFIIMWVIIQLQGITGGVNGLPVPRAEIFGYVIKTKASFYYLVMVLACIGTYLAKNIVRSRVGRAFIAIRDNDLAAEVMGINLWIYKLQAFFIGCVYAGVAGSLSVQYIAFANTDQFPFWNSVWYLGMLIVGGMGSTVGVIFGVIALSLLDELVIVLGPVLAAIFVPQAAAALSLILRGLLIIVFLIFEPKGLVHWWERIKTYFRLWPFSS